jgi:hypothetical protein
MSPFSLFGWLVADGRCWFVLREKYCWLVLAGCWWLVFLREKYCWLVADKPSEQGVCPKGDASYIYQSAQSLLEVI